MRLRMLAAAAVLIGAGCAATPTTITPVPRRVEIPDAGAVLPVTWRDDAILVEVHIDGRGPYTFVLDTGAATNVVSRRVADARWDAVVAMDDRGHDAEGRTVKLNTGLRIGSLRAGDLVLRELAAVVLDLEALHPYVRFPMDGILGYPAFENLLLTVDYPGRSVTARRGSLGAVDGITVLDDLGTSVPIVSVGTPSGPLALMLDTGSREALALPRWLEHAPRPGNPFVGTRGIAAGGPTDRSAEARQACTISLGGHDIVDPIVTITRGAPRVGTRVLRDFRLTFDPTGRRVGVERRGNGVLRTAALRGIGARFRDDGEGWMVWDVAPGSPAAEAGLRVDDRVLRIDGIDCEAANDDRLRALLRTPGAAPVLRVVRGDGVEEMAVPVGDLVP